jgi:hypothetical protein
MARRCGQTQRHMLHSLWFAAAVALTLAATSFAAAQTPASQAPAPAPTSSPAASPAAYAPPTNPPENPLVTARVRSEFLAGQNGHINRATYTPQAGGVYIDALVRIEQPDLAAIGPPQTVTYQTASLLFGDLVYRYDVTGPSGVVSVLYWLDDRGKTDGIVFTPKIFAAPATPQ